MATETRYKNNKKWEVLPPADPEAAEKIAEALNISNAAARLLYKRGCHTVEDANAFVRFEKGQLHDPRLMPDIDKAVEKIKEALEKNKRIIIYGDYDVDGVTSVSVLYLFLKRKGADVGYYIPQRSKEGYGMSSDVIRKMVEDGAGLIITVDTGITAIEEVRLARELGCDVVVTDHHECREELPCACAVVNPQRHDSEYPFCELAGVGVVYKLICAIECELSETKDMEKAILGVSSEYIDLVAIGTVADVMPVRDENRMIVSYGLSKIEHSERCGLKALMAAAAAPVQTAYAPKNVKKPRITSSYISYTIAPRINAAGRISDASAAVELFLTEDDKKAAELAEDLCRVNRERQALENVIAEEAYAKAEATHDFANDPVIVLHDDMWHNGIIGIVASRVTEKYGMPSILISFEGCAGDEKDFGKGSGRSIKGLNLVESLGECGDILEKYGGHELAAGLTVRRDRLDDFKRAINDAARKRLAMSSEEPTSVADDSLEFNEITLGLAEDMLLMEPFGVGNPLPIYVSRGVTVRSVIGVGSNKHTKFIFTDGKTSVAAMCFSASPQELDVHEGDIVDVMYNIDINEFRGERSVQMIIRAIRKNELQLKDDNSEYDLYKSIRACVPEKIDYEKYVPEKCDFAAVYRMIRHEISMGRNRITARGAVALVQEAVEMNYVKLKIIFDVFSEMNILHIEEVSADVYNVYAANNTKKVQLERSAILKRLRSKYKYK